jgi:hypothetical protein
MHRPTEGHIGIHRSLPLLAFLALSAAAAMVMYPRAANSVSADPRYAGMPVPELMGAPAGAARQSGNAAAYTIGATTIRLSGTQFLYRIDGTGTITARHRVDMGPGSVFGSRDQTEFFAARQFIKLLDGPYAGWWVETPAASLAPSARYSPAAQVRLTAGSHLGVRFYADGTVRTRRSASLNSPAVFTATKSTVVNGRTYFYLTAGPFADRWVASGSGATLVNGGGDTAAPTSPPTASPTASPRASPTATPTPSPTTPPAATPTPAPTPAPAGTWKAVVLVYRETDVTFTQADGTDYHLHVQMGDTMHNLVLDTLGRFRSAVSSWSGGLAAMKMDIVDVPHALTSLDKIGSAYWVGPQSVEADIDRYAPTGSYDSVFVVWQARDNSGVDVPVGGWGLTLPPGSWANGAGYSSLITPSEMWWWTSSSAPEEVFVHEWMHQVVYFNEQQGRLDTFDLHAGPTYGYHDDNGSWKHWLSDVMQDKVWDTDHYIGISPAMWAAGTPSNP